MALSFVQSKSVKQETADRTPTITLDAAPTEGNLVVVCVTWSQSTGNATWSNPGGWTLDGTDGDVSNSGEVHSVLVYKQAGAGESDTITFTNAISAAREWSMYVIEFSGGGSGTWTKDQSAHADTDNTTTPVTGTTPTTTVADEVAVGFVGIRNQATPSSPTNSFTLQETQVASTSSGTHTSGALMYRIVSATGTYSTGCTLSTQRNVADMIHTWYFTASGATHTKAGAVISAAVASGADAFTATDSGSAISAASAAGDQSFVLNRAGAAISALVASGADVFTATETGAVISEAKLSGISFETIAQFEAELIVEMAFGYGPGDNSVVWTDISSYVRSANWQRGRQNELNQMQAGIGSLLLADPESDFDSRNALSPFSPNIKPGTPIRARMKITNLLGVTTYYPLFRMVTERQPRTLRVTDAYTERQLDMIDGFAILANAGLAGFSYPLFQSSSDRVEDVLDDINWPASNRDIGVGIATLMGVTFPDDDDIRALTHLLAVNDTEDGFLFCNGSGAVALIGRHELRTDPLYSVSQATFRDADGSDGYPYTELLPSYDLDQVVNKWTGAREGGLPQTFEDAASISDFFLRSKQLSSIAATDPEVLNQVQWKTRLFAQPLNRVESITVMPFRDCQDEDQIVASLEREIGDRITVLETPPGFASEQEDEYVIQHLEGTVQPGPLVTMRLKFLLWPTHDEDFWLAGDAALSLAGQTTIPGY